MSLGARACCVCETVGPIPFRCYSFVIVIYFVCCLVLVCARMDLEDFEFDLSDVDVAAFESVATEDYIQQERKQDGEVQEKLEEQKVEEENGGEDKTEEVARNEEEEGGQESVQQTGQDKEQEPELEPNQNQNQNQLQTQTQKQQQRQLYLVVKIAPPKQQSPKKVLSKANANIPVPTPKDFSQSPSTKRKPCNCTKSQCLKLYCDCFANGEFCSGCNCTNCFNCLPKERERQKAISQCLERNPEAFRPKIGRAKALDSIGRRHTKGCNCKRSGCLKNYCECYEAKILCSNLCKCCGCKNYEESFERRSLLQLTSTASDQTRGILKNLLPAISNSSSGEESKNCLITDKFIQCTLTSLLQSVQKAEKEGVAQNNMTNLIHKEMGKYLRMIKGSVNTETTGNAKRLIENDPCHKKT